MLGNIDVRQVVGPTVTSTRTDPNPRRRAPSVMALISSAASWIAAMVAGDSSIAGSSALGAARIALSCVEGSVKLWMKESVSALEYCGEAWLSREDG